MIRVLFIENDKFVIENSKSFFDNDPNFQLIIEKDRNKAIKKINKAQFDAIITGCNLPDIDDISFIKNIRKKCPNIPMGIFSFKEKEDLIIKALNDGVDFFVQKEKSKLKQFKELSFRIQFTINRYENLKNFKQSEERFRILTEESPDMILQLDSNHRIIYANKTFLENTGNEPDSVIGKDYSELQDSTKNIQIWDKQITKTQRTGKPSSAEYQKKDGKWYDRILFPRFDITSNIQFFTITSREITEKKKIEKEKEEFLRELVQQKGFTEALLDAIPIPVQWKNNKKQYVGCNKAFVEFTGISREELIGKTYFEVWSKEEANICDYYDQKLISEGHLPPYQSSLKDKSGRKHEIIHSKNLFFDHLGNIAGIVGSFQDITEENRLIRNLKNSEELFRMIITQSSDIFIIITHELEISYISPRIEPMSGFLSEEILGPVKRYVHPDDYEFVIKIIHRLIKNSSLVEEAEFRTRKRDGSYMVMDGIAINCIENPAINGILVTARDITGHKKIEKQLSRINTLFQSILDYSIVQYLL